MKVEYHKVNDKEEQTRDLLKSMLEQKLLVHLIQKGDENIINGTIQEVTDSYYYIKTQKSSEIKKLKYHDLKHIWSTKQ